MCDRPQTAECYAHSAIITTTPLGTILIGTPPTGCPPPPQSITASMLTSLPPPNPQENLKKYLSEQDDLSMSDLWPKDGQSTVLGECNQEEQAFALNVAEGVRNREFQLVPVSEGLGGSYFVVGQLNQHIAIFKPSVREVGMPQNPKNNTEDVKAGFPPGMGYLREIAAYRLDHDHHAKVPVTVEAELLGEVGSLQQFVHSDGDGFDCGPARYKAEDVHAFGILDIRILNCDRHDGNILHARDPDVSGTTRRDCSLYPIDHGYAFPEEGRLQDLEFEWLNYPQSKEPFGPRALAYIASLDADADMRTLRAMGFPEEVAENTKAATIVLQVGASSGRTLREIGEYCRRTQMTQPSGLECALASSRMDMDHGGDIDWERFKEVVTEAFDFSSESTSDNSSFSFY